MNILGIETSCDETAVSVVEGIRNRLTIRSHIISSQIPTHRKFGGVVPEVAARHHVINMIPVAAAALRQAHMTHRNIRAIAVTRGPGLVTSLRVGVQTAKALSYAWHLPLIGVNHMEGHIYANWQGSPHIKFPVLCLVVSGGHTELILMRNHGDYRLIGRTRDDAAGEAFDKVAKLLGIPYPGGPHIQQLAAKGDPKRFPLPRPMLHNKDFDFSFAGLKTAVLYLVKREFPHGHIPIADVCASFQQAVTDVLVAKTVRAAQHEKVKTVILAGGVAANKPLRAELGTTLRQQNPLIDYQTPALNLCTDNASMIAMAGYFHARHEDYGNWKTMEANPNWELV